MLARARVFVAVAFSHRSAAPPVFLIQTSCTFFFLHARTFTKRTRTSESIHTIVIHTYCILVFFEGVNDDTCVLLLLLLLVL